jgi:hypothetical protein
VAHELFENFDRIKHPPIVRPHLQVGKASPTLPYFAPV